jgi:hypothetical protein
MRLKVSIDIHRDFGPYSGRASRAGRSIAAKHTEAGQLFEGQVDALLTYVTVGVDSTEAIQSGVIFEVRRGALKFRVTATR